MNECALFKGGTKPFGGKEVSGEGMKWDTTKVHCGIIGPFEGVFVLGCRLKKKKHGQARSILLCRDHSLVRIGLLLRVRMRYSGVAVSARERQMAVATYQAGRLCPCRMSYSARLNDTG